MARELAKQWINFEIIPANVQGAQIYTQSIPEYLALLFMKETFGMNQTAQWLEGNYEDYAEGKGEEEISEKPLLYSDDAPYVSMKKGGCVLFALSQRAGVNQFSNWLASWLRARKYNGNDFIVSNEFYNDVIKTLPVSLHAFTDECFNQRIQYQLSLGSIKTESSSVRL